MISKSTGREILNIIRNYVDRKEIDDLLRELSEVKGNKSFSDSMVLLLQLWQRRPVE